MDLSEKTLTELRSLLDKREISSLELTKFYIKKINETDSKINAFITKTPEIALQMAEQADEIIKSKKSTSLTGIPIGIKDLIITKGIKTTCASKILKNFIPPYDATVIKKLKEDNAVFVGKLNMDEFAMGSSNENSFLGPVKNPYDVDRVSGGSSGGSAAAVASMQIPASLGSDTGGSIRQPASFCGVVGLKPTYGRVSRYGLIAFASSLDQIGPIARNVTDAAIVFYSIAGYDPMDSTSIDIKKPDLNKCLEQNIRGLKIGVPKEYFSKGLDPEVENSVRWSINKLEDEGAQIVELSLPHTEYAVAAYYLIATAEASSNLARFDGVRYGSRIEKDNIIETYKNTRENGFGEEVKRRIMLGTYALSAGYYDAYYRRAQRVRYLISEDFRKAFEKVDIIIGPTCPTPAFRMGEMIDDPLKMYLADIYTIPCNLAGLPGISIPCGYSQKGLPIGLQLLASPFNEEILLKVAYSFEKTSGLKKRVPVL